MKNIKCLSSIMLLTIVMTLSRTAPLEASAATKISVFNFNATNLEATGYNTTVTNMLLNSLGNDPSFSVLDRKELEAFLNLNDLQQSDNVENAIHIGSRLGLNAIVIGSVEKRGPVIIVNCRVVSIDKKRAILSTQVRSLGDAGLVEEVRKLHKAITTAIAKEATASDEKLSFPGPVNIQKRAGNKSIYLSWEDAPGTKATEYEIFRSTRADGPYTKIGEVKWPEYLDQNLERNVTYFYKIRSVSNKGLRSDFSAVISGETALTPNPPIILKAESHVKSIQLTWTPNPTASEDPLKLVGYKVYRAKTEKGPYREIANILTSEIGGTSAPTLDKLFRVSYTDKGLADGEDYFYKITAYNEKNLESEFSTPIKGSTLPIVSQVKIKGDMIREIHLVWNAIDSPFIKGYYVYRSTSEGGNYTKIKKISTLGMETNKVIQYIDKEGLGDKTRYYYRITAFEDDDMETSPSPTVSAETKGKPPVPTNLKAKSGLVKQVEISWTPSPDPDVVGYNLYWSLQKTGKYELLKRISDRMERSFTHGGGFNKLLDNTTYYYFITAYNKVDVESEQSEVVAATTKPRPSIPKAFKGEAGKVKSVPLSWEQNPEGDVEKYHIFRADGKEKDFSRIATVRNKTHYLDTGLKDGEEYRYRIQAEDKDELLSDLSEAITVKTKPRPSKPTKVAGDIREGNVRLTWSSSPESDISHYVVYEKKFFGPSKIAEVTVPQFVEPSPPRGKSKTYIITAVDKDGLESEASDEISVTGK
ncbi:MAG: hypothetical protein N2572_06110 [Syntrophales bacterium]|nr:hypothetical protein [Syntrophales bacterium]